MAITGLKVSDKIQAFINFYDEAIKVYKYSYEKVNACDKLKCDLLHKIELGLYADRNEKARIQTQLEYCLKDRRYYKDKVEELEPFIKLFLTESKDYEHVTRQCSSAINFIKNSLGAVRKMESYHADRRYKPRILKDIYGEE